MIDSRAVDSRRRKVRDTAAPLLTEAQTSCWPMPPPPRVWTTRRCC